MDIRAVIFDMDGVLIASEPILTQICIDLFAKSGVHATPKDFMPYIGMGEEPFIRNVAEQYGLVYTPAMKQYCYDTYIDYVKSHDCRLPGTGELFAYLQAQGIRAAIASSADRVKLMANIAAAGLLPQQLAVITAGDDVIRRKPDPAIYVKTAQALGVDPAHCLVVEDAIAGVQAGVAAGMAVVGITSTFSRQQLTAAGATAVLAQLADLQPWLQQSLAQ